MVTRLKTLMGWQYFIPVLLLVISLIIRLIMAAVVSVEVDEPVNWWLSRTAAASGYPTLRPSVDADVRPFFFHPPFAFYLYGLVSQTIVSARMLAVGMWVTTMLMIYMFMRKAQSPAVATATLFFFAMDSWLIVTGSMMLIENLIIPLSVAAMALYFWSMQDDGDKWYRFVLTGVAIGCAIIIKHIAAYLLLGVALNLLLARRRWISHALMLAVVFGIVGAYSTTMFSLFGVTWLNDTWVQIFRSTGTYDSPSMNIDIGTIVTVITERYWIFPMTIFALLAGGSIAAFRYVRMLISSYDVKTGTMVSFAVGAALSAVTLSLKGPHYFMLWLVALYPLIAMSIPQRVFAMKRVVAVLIVGFAVLNIAGVAVRATYTDAVQAAASYINTALPDDAVVATEPYVGMLIEQPYLRIRKVAAGQEGMIDYMAVYSSTTAERPEIADKLGCTEMLTFKGFKDSVEVCRVSP